jgi:hypothetical protein
MGWDGGLVTTVFWLYKTPIEAQIGGGDGDAFTILHFNLVQITVHNT